MHKPDLQHGVISTLPSLLKSMSQVAHAHCWECHGCIPQLSRDFTWFDEQAIYPARLASGCLHAEYLFHL